MKNLRPILLPVTILLFGVDSVGFAQVLYGTLLGKVSSMDGRSIPAARVQAIGTDTGIRKQVDTDENGSWSFRDLLPGVYDLEVSASGFSTVSLKAVQVSANSITRSDAELPVIAQAQAIEVIASASVLQTDSGALQKEITAHDTRNIPLTGYRNYQSLLDLVPGATPSRLQNSVMDTPSRSLTTNINGASRNTNVTAVDGAAIQQIYLPHHTLYNPPADAIEAVNVATNSFNAEQGLAGGAAVTVITKSGTNELRGLLHHNHTNSALAARNFFFLGQNVPLNLINQFGATLGGPIRKDKLFFFTGYEGLIQRQNYSTITSVPTAAQRAGNFDGLTTVFDPATGAPDGSGRTPFSSGVVPASRQSPAAQKTLGLVPLPNLGGTANNFFVGDNFGLDRHSIDAKVNWQIDESSSLFGKLSRMDAEVVAGTSLGAGGGFGLSPGGANAGSGYSRTKVTVLGVGYTKALRPNIVLDANFGFGRNWIDWTGLNFGRNLGTDLLGIPGTNGPDERSSGLPSFAVSGFETMGDTDPYVPKFFRDNTYTYVANVGWNRGAHTLRFGYSGLNNHLNEFQPQRGFGPRGGFIFRGGVTALRGGSSPNASNALADFLLGQATSLGKSYQILDPMTGREWQHGLYAQDQWLVNSRLTVTMGLRWEYFPIMGRATRGLERYDFTNNRVVVGGIRGNPNGAGTTASLRHFAPRFGFAYRSNAKTVIRGGYGISTDPYPFTRAMRDPYPVTVAQTINSSSSFIPAGSLTEGIPAITPVDTSTGSVPLPLDAYTRTLYEGQFQRGYIQSFNLTVERRLPGDLTLSGGYVGTRVVRQLATIEANAGQIPGAGAAGQPLFLAFRRNSQTQAITSNDSANYNGLQWNLRRRFAQGFSLTASYTWSKTIDSGSDSDSVPLFNIVGARARNRAVANFDRTHVFQSAIVWEVRSPKTSNRVIDFLAGGWQISGFFSAYTGLPFTPTADGTTLNAPFNTQVADQIAAEVSYPKGIGAGSPWFDTKAYTSVSQPRFGTAGRNSLRGPGVANIDLGLARRFKISERLGLEVRGEAFNLTNSPIFANPAGNASIGTFGQITSTAGTTADSRVIRVAARLNF
jgi:hypothetical protein